VTLSRTDPHHWCPIPIITEWLTRRVIPADALVVDVGCGHNPFPRADIGLDRRNRATLEKIWKKVGVKPKPKLRTYSVDFTKTMPFKDKGIDFAYCRHTLEDMNDPFELVKELQRVAKAGYIETPSPIAELVRGVDGFANSDLYRGYYHHRWFIWVGDGVLNFVEKLPIMEHFVFHEAELEDGLRHGPELWNTYYLWDGEIKWKHWREEIDFRFETDYLPRLWTAAMQSIESTDVFCRMIDNQRKERAA
jgi:SAM-dependent methyltransferase